MPGPGCIARKKALSLSISLSQSRSISQSLSSLSRNLSLSCHRAQKAACPHATIPCRSQLESLRLQHLRAAHPQPVRRLRQIPGPGRIRIHEPRRVRSAMPPQCLCFVITPSTKRERTSVCCALTRVPVLTSPSGRSCWMSYNRTAAGKQIGDPVKFPSRMAQPKRWTNPV